MNGIKVPGISDPLVDIESEEVEKVLNAWQEKFENLPYVYMVGTYHDYKSKYRNRELPPYCFYVCYLTNEQIRFETDLEIHPTGRCIDIWKRNPITQRDELKREGDGFRIHSFSFREIDTIPDFYNRLLRFLQTSVWDHELPPHLIQKSKLPPMPEE